MMRDSCSSELVKVIEAANQDYVRVLTLLLLDDWAVNFYLWEDEWYPVGIIGDFLLYLDHKHQNEL